MPDGPAWSGVQLDLVSFYFSKWAKWPGWYKCLLMGISGPRLALWPSKSGLLAQMYFFGGLERTGLLDLENFSDGHNGPYGPNGPSGPSVPVSPGPGTYIPTRDIWANF